MMVDGAGMYSGPDSSAPRLFIACDFDGTITERDTLDLVVRRYAPGVWDSVEARLRAGEIDMFGAMREEFEHVRAREADVVAHVLAEAGIRPGFSEFVRWIEDEGHRLLVVSAGFRSLIDPVLASAGLSHLHVHAGDALFTIEGTWIAFPPSRMPCVAECAHCKRETIAAHGPFGGPVVYIGDGFSDRCASGVADVIFARRELARHLDDEGIAYHPFDDFHQVREILARPSRS
jgi:2-hydroxy-3-keto-5-methylthiopentenyl-1-phosphate phosphatase